MDALCGTCYDAVLLIFVSSLMFLVIFLAIKDKQTIAVQELTGLRIQRPGCGVYTSWTELHVFPMYFVSRVSPIVVSHFVVWCSSGWLHCLEVQVAPILQRLSHSTAPQTGWLVGSKPEVHPGHGARPPKASTREAGVPGPQRSGQSGTRGLRRGGRRVEGGHGEAAAVLFEVGALHLPAVRVPFLQQRRHLRSAVGGAREAVRVCGYSVPG